MSKITFFTAPELKKIPVKWYATVWFQRVVTLPNIKTSPCVAKVSSGSVPLARGIVGLPITTLVDWWRARPAVSWISSNYRIACLSWSSITFTFRKRQCRMSWSTPEENLLFSKCLVECVRLEEVRKVPSQEPIRGHHTAVTLSGLSV